MTDAAPVPVSDGDRSPRRGFLSWPRAGRWAVYVAVVLVLALVAVSVAAVITVRRPFPQTSGRIAVPGLGGKVEVVRDAYGIPQIYADKAEDLFYAQGFVQAQDRFFQMDFRRHVTAGRLSELVGKDALETDMYIRAMGWRRVAEKELSLLSPETLSYLQSFSAGVNAYIHTHTATEMSLEYSVLSANGLHYRVQDWTPVDSLAWLKAMAWDLRGNMQQEIERAIASARVTPAQIDEIFPPYPYDRHPPIVEEGSVVDGRFEQQTATRGRARPALSGPLLRSLGRLDAGLDRMPELVGSGTGVGSNGWVVAGDRSTTGKPILANDPHLGISVPGVWYQTGLHCNTLNDACPYDVTGFTFAGLPGVVIGHNQQIAWGFTNMGPDVTDLYLEKVEGKNYTYGKRSRPLAMRDESIDVFGQKEPFRFTVRSTRHGPLLSDVSAQLSTVGANAPTGKGAPERGNGYAVALSWTALTPGRTADALFELDRATRWEEFRAAAKDFAVPSQNIVYADRAGHIGYQAPGRIPIRAHGNTGLYPTEGWKPENDWTGRFVPFAALPNELDPEQGFIATANQAVVGPGYPYYLGGDPGSFGYRSDRIADLLQHKRRLGVADMARIQLDTRNGFAPTFVPYLLSILMPSQYLASGQRLLDKWDYRQTPDSAAAAYYNAVWRQTLALTFHDQLQESIWPDGGDRWFEVMRRLLAHPTNGWWDDVATEGVVETRDDILLRAMAEARDELVRTQARRAVDWDWGHHHVMNLENQPLGQSDVGVVRWLFNRGGYEVGGGSDIVDATSWTAPNGYQVDWAPSMRMVVSLANLDDSTWVNLTGASGHAFDAHYIDQTELWLQGRSMPWAFSRKQVEATEDQRLTLVPGGSG